MEAVSEQAVLDALATVPDPEVGVDIVNLGLIYRVEIQPERVHIDMTMTTPACPLHEQMQQDVEAAIMGRHPQVKTVEIELVWEPPWNPRMMTAAARQALGWPD